MNKNIHKSIFTYIMTYPNVKSISFGFSVSPNMGILTSPKMTILSIDNTTIRETKFIGPQYYYWKINLHQLLLKEPLIKLTYFFGRHPLLKPGRMLFVRMIFFNFIFLWSFDFEYPVSWAVYLTEISLLSFTIQMTLSPISGSLSSYFFIFCDQTLQIQQIIYYWSKHLPVR